MYLFSIIVPAPEISPSTTARIKFKFKQECSSVLCRTIFKVVEVIVVNAGVGGRYVGGEVCF